MNSNSRIAATLYSLDIVCLRNISRNTLHKGDDDDDDDNNNNNNNQRLCKVIRRMWNLKCTIMPVIIGATRIVTRSLRKNLEAVDSIDSLQKTAILGTSHIIRKVLQCEA